jgi:hypothetical protein
VQKLPIRDVFHSTQSSAKVKDEWSRTSPSVSLHSVDSYNFTLYCTPKFFLFCFDKTNFIRWIFNWLHPVMRVSNVKDSSFNSFLTVDKATKLTSVAAWTTNIPQSAHRILVVQKAHNTLRCYPGTVVIDYDIEWIGFAANCDALVDRGYVCCSYFSNLTSFCKLIFGWIISAFILTGVWSETD